MLRKTTMKLPAISVEALIVLDAIAERGSYAAAAEYLNKVPSALSYVVQKLEEQLDVTIFQRQGRRSALTPAGKYLLSEGRHLLVAINKISDKTKTIANGWEPSINIAFDTIIDMAIFLPSLRDFLNKHQNIEIDIREESLNGSWETLINDDVDLLIGASGAIPAHKGIRALPIGQLSLVFCVGADHILAKNHQRPIQRAELSQYRTVVIHDSTISFAPKTTSGVIEQSQHFYVTTLEQKLKAIKAGLGGGYLPIKRIQPFIERGELVVLNVVEPLPENELYLAWKVVNKGKGLQQLITLLTAANLSLNI